MRLTVTVDIKKEVYYKHCELPVFLLIFLLISITYKVPVVTLCRQIYVIPYRLNLNICNY